MSMLLLLHNLTFNLWKIYRISCSSWIAHYSNNKGRGTVAFLPASDDADTLCFRLELPSRCPSAWRTSKT